MCTSQGSSISHASLHTTHMLLVCAQVIAEGMGAAFLKLKLRDQERSMHVLESDPALEGLLRLQVPVRSALCSL